MRPHLRQFLDLCAQTLVCPEPIVEIGAFQVVGTEAIADLRPLFSGKIYIDCDMRPGVGLDRIEDIHHLRSVRMKLAPSFWPTRIPCAMREIHRCLHANGVVICSSAVCFPIHDYPNDYWRLTPEAFRALVSDFPYAAIFFCSPPEFPNTVCVIAAKNKYDATPIKTVAERARHQENGAPHCRGGPHCEDHPPPYDETGAGKEHSVARNLRRFRQTRAAAGFWSRVNGLPVGSRWRMCVRLKFSLAILSFTTPD
jgi:hypothetical protein